MTITLHAFESVFDQTPRPHDQKSTTKVLAFQPITDLAESHDQYELQYQNLYTVAENGQVSLTTDTTGARADGAVAPLGWAHETRLNPNVKQNVHLCTYTHDSGANVNRYASKADSYEVRINSERACYPQAPCVATTCYQYPSTLNGLPVPDHASTGCNIIAGYRVTCEETGSSAMEDRVDIASVVIQDVSTVLNKASYDSNVVVNGVNCSASNFWYPHMKSACLCTTGATCVPTNLDHTGAPALADGVMVQPEGFDYHPAGNNPFAEHDQLYRLECGASSTQCESAGATPVMGQAIATLLMVQSPILPHGEMAL